MASNLINFDGSIKPQILVPRLNNPSPYVLTSEWTDFPLTHLLNVQGSIALGLWLSFEDLVNMSLRIVATESREELDFYSLPIQTVYTGYSTLTPQEFRIPASTEKILVSLPLGGVINYCKIQVKGDGKILRAIATVNGRTL